MFVVIVGKRGAEFLRRPYRAVLTGIRKRQSETTGYEVGCFDIVPCRREPAEVAYAHRNRNHHLIEDNPASG